MGLWRARMSLSAGFLPKDTKPNFAYQRLPECARSLSIPNRRCWPDPSNKFLLWFLGGDNARDGFEVISNLYLRPRAEELFDPFGNGAADFDYQPARCFQHRVSLRDEAFDDL